MPFTPDAERRIVAACALVEKYLLPGVRGGNYPTSQPTEHFIWAKITDVDSSDDTMSLYSWKRQKINNDGVFEDDDDHTGDSDAITPNNEDADIDGIYRMIYVGGETANWLIQVGGSSGAPMILFHLTGGFSSGTTTVSVIVNAVSAGTSVDVGDTITVSNNLGYSGSTGQLGTAWQDTVGVWHLIGPQCHA